MTENMIIRPTPVTVIAIYYFGAAGAALLMIVVSFLDPDLNGSSSLFSRMMFYVLTRHNLSSPAMIPVVMPFVAVYFALIGWGLWRLKKWARNLVIGTSGLIVLLWLRAFVLREWAMGETLLKDKLAENTVYGMILINAMIFCCLTLYPDVARAFGQDDE